MACVAFASDENVSLMIEADIMRYLLTGDRRFALDFKYVFSNLDIVGYCSLESVATSDLMHEMLIICAYDKDEASSILAAEGYSYKDDFLYAEDFFADLDSFRIPKDRDMALWGDGKIGAAFLESHSDMNFSCVISSFKAKKEFKGIPEVGPEDVENWKKYFVIIAVYADDEIVDYLSGLGLKEFVDYVSYQQLEGMPSTLIKRTIYDRHYYKFTCKTMLNHLEILNEGKTRCCCTTFVGQDLGRVTNGKVWNSNTHKIMSLSCANHTYSFCDKTMCPLFVAEEPLDSRNVSFVEDYDRECDYPETLGLSYDSSCNLYCSTCRNERYIAKGKDSEKLRKITEIVKDEYLENVKFLILAGDGEVFMSPEYQSVYTDSRCNPDYIRILSNGMLFTENKWHDLVAGKNAVIMATFSIDAATKETYERIRRGGNFDIIRKNMEFASKLRKSGELRYFRMNFVVQRENYEEMIAFTKWGEELGVDEVFFTKILNWGTYTADEFDEISMMERDGITPKPELKRVLESEEIKNSKIVDLGTIQYAHKHDDVGVVKNYYMWELEKRGGKIFD